MGTRSKARLAELEKREVAQAQAAHARWPPSPDITENIQELTRELKLCDVPRSHSKLCWLPVICLNIYGGSTQ